MKILITGATGFLGGQITRQLAATHDLRLVVRRTSDRTGLPEGAELIEADVTDPAAVTRAAAGCHAAIHAAALVKILAPARRYDQVNVAGLQHALKAARQHGLERFIYISSFIALGPSDQAPGRVLDESAPPDQPPWINHYHRTKALAERLARQAIADGQAINIVYPGVVYGPGRLTDGNLVVRRLLEMAAGKLPARIGDDQRRWNYVHVEDVARGVAAVLDQAPPGKRYILGGENVSLQAFYQLADRLAGPIVPRRHLPDPLARALGLVMKTWARVVGGQPRLTPDLVKTFGHDWVYDSTAAQQDLGYTWRPLEEGLAQTLAWLKEIGRWPR